MNKEYKYPQKLIDYKSSDKVIKTFYVLWSGWDCDDKGKVMENEFGVRYIMMTNHGTPYVASFSELEEKIREYREAIDETKNAIELVKEYETRE